MNCLMVGWLNCLIRQNLVLWEVASLPMFSAVVCKGNTTCHFAYELQKQTLLKYSQSIKLCFSHFCKWGLGAWPISR